MIPYLAVAALAAALAAVALVALLAGWKQTDRSLSPLGHLGFPLILAGIVFGQDQRVSYSLLASGLVLLAIDAWHRKHFA